MNPEWSYAICHDADKLTARVAQALAEPLRKGLSACCDVYSQDDGGVMEQVLLLLTDELRPYYRTGDPRLYNLEPPLQLAHLSVRYNDGGQVTQDLLWIKAGRANRGLMRFEHGRPVLTWCECECSRDLHAYVERGLIIAPPTQWPEHIVHLQVPDTDGVGHLEMRFHRKLWKDEEESTRTQAKSQDITLFAQDFNGASMAPVVLVSVPRTRMGKHWAVDPKRFVITTSGQEPPVAGHDPVECKHASEIAALIGKLKALKPEMDCL